MVTGYGNPDLERQAAAAGIDRVLLKPCLPQAVMREISRTLARPPGARPSRQGPPLGEAAIRIRDEFGALPGLSLTAEQARLVFELDRDMCEQILAALVGEGYLSRSPQGTYRRER